MLNSSCDGYNKFPQGTVALWCRWVVMIWVSDELCKMSSTFYTRPPVGLAVRSRQEISMHAALCAFLCEHDSKSYLELPKNQIDRLNLIGSLVAYVVYVLCYVSMCAVSNYIIG